MKRKSVWIALPMAFSVLAWDPRITEDGFYIGDSFLNSDPEHVQPIAPLSIPTSIFFVGDIALGRFVETKMETQGVVYPFENVLNDIFIPDFTVGNFEGVVTETHTQTPPFTFRFSVKHEYLSLLKTLGFDALSLANNHSLDYGTSSLAYTRRECALLDIICAGSPKSIDADSILIKKIGTHTVGIIFIHTLYGEPDEEVLNAKLAEMRKSSEVQIAYVHWGEEYMRTHNASQEQLAHLLIDNGVDVVIGHHPHVVEDVKLYNNGLVVYSLGNFIFDQYFSDDVQQMIGLHMSIEDTHITYKIVPLSSIETRSQPHHMDKEDATILLKRIFAPIAQHEGVHVSEGTIRVSR